MGFNIGSIFGSSGGGSAGITGSHKSDNSVNTTYDYSFKPAIGQAQGPVQLGGAIGYAPGNPTAPGTGGGGVPDPFAADTANKSNFAKYATIAGLGIVAILGIVFIARR